jgi:hypothetical protein
MKQKFIVVKMFKDEPNGVLGFDCGGIETQESAEAYAQHMENDEARSAVQYRRFVIPAIEVGQD